LKPAYTQRKAANTMGGSGRWLPCMG
jgi:hypothetical protein